jgi:hypothetical protein
MKAVQRNPVRQRPQLEQEGPGKRSDRARRQRLRRANSGLPRIVG